MLRQCPQCRTLVTASDDADELECPHCGSHFAVSDVSESVPDALDWQPGERAAAATGLAADFPVGARARPRTRWRWMLAALLLLLTLFLQAGYFERAQLSQSPRLRPWLETLCGIARCRLPLYQAPRQLRIVARDVRSHPEAAASLLVSATLRNDAPFAQAYPDLMLRFSDLQGTIIAQRRFHPREYLAAGHLDLSAGIPPRRPLLIRLELQDPGPQAVNYEFALIN